MIANRIDAIEIISEETRGLVTVLTTRCEDYDAYRELPQAVVFEGRNFGKTGWNSDDRIAYYRNDASIAFAIREAA